MPRISTFIFCGLFLIFGLSNVYVYGQGGLVSGVRPENPEVDQGVRSALQGDNEAAARHFAEAMEKRPGSRPGGIDAAMAMTESGFDAVQYGKMRFWLEKTAEDFPDDPEAFLLLASIALADRRYVESNMLTHHGLERVDRLGSDSERQKKLRIDGETILSKIAEHRQRWTDVIEQLGKLRELEPENAEHLYRLGLARYRLGQMEEAIQTLNDAEAMDSKILPALVVLAQLAEFDGNRDDAIRYVDESLEKQSNDPRVLLAAADLQMVWNHLEKAGELAEKARQINPNLLEPLMILGIVDLYAENFEQAEEKFMKIMESQPENAKAMTGLALALSEQADPRQLRRAFAIAKKNVDRNPESLDAQTTLAWVLIKANSLADAEKILMRQFDAGELNSPGAYYLAEIFSQRNRTDEAILFLKTALATEVNFPKRVAAEKLLENLTSR